VDKKDEGEISFPPFDVKWNRRRLFLKSISSISLIAIFTTVLINLLTFNGILWSAIVVASVLYAWIVCGWLTFKKNSHVSVKLMIHAATLPMLLLVIEAFSTTAIAITNANWALSYTMPSIYIAFTLVINILMIIKRRKSRDYLISSFALSIIGFVPLILVFFGLVNPIYMSIASAGLSFATIIALLIFGRKIVFSEISRKFHV
jgi:hypothetical protein